MQKALQRREIPLFPLPFNYSGHNGLLKRNKSIKAWGLLLKEELNQAELNQPGSMVAAGTQVVRTLWCA